MVAVSIFRKVGQFQVSAFWLAINGLITASNSTPISFQYNSYIFIKYDDKDDSAQIKFANFAFVTVIVLLDGYNLVLSYESVY